MLTRRIWIFPVWLWLIIIVAAALIVMKLRKDKGGTGSSLLGSGNLSDQPVLLMSWPADEWTTAKSKPGGADAGTGGAGNTPAPAPRVTTGTYTGNYVPDFGMAPKISVRKSTAQRIVWPG